MYGLRVIYQGRASGMNDAYALMMRSDLTRDMIREREFAWVRVLVLYVYRCCVSSDTSASSMTLRGSLESSGSYGIRCMYL